MSSINLDWRFHSRNKSYTFRLSFFRFGFLRLFTLHEHFRWLKDQSKLIPLIIKTSKTTSWHSLYFFFFFHIAWRFSKGKVNRDQRSSQQCVAHNGRKKPPCVCKLFEFVWQSETEIKVKCYLCLPLRLFHVSFPSCALTPVNDNL